MWTACRRAVGSSVNYRDTSPSIGERSARWTRESDSSHAHRERPRDAAYGLVGPPARAELVDDRRNGIMTLRARPLHRRPGGEVADELGERPLGLHGER